ncbi:MAG TPA: hypothetical protein VHL52_01270 [Acidimicrobiia bacterium]|nr:hypothetical protein [Acidimicrobiia bacterium]
MTASRRKWARGAAGALLLIVVAAVVGAIWLAGTFDVSVSTLPYALVGTAIIWQRPRTVIGWVLLLFALLWSSTFLGVDVATQSDNESLVWIAAWVGEWTWFPALVSVFVVLPILFPTGRPIGRGWAAVLGLAVVVSVGFVIVTSIQAEFRPTETMVVPNPWVLLGLADAEVLLVPAVIPLLLLGPVAAVVRYRRSSGVERQQIRWFMYAAVACGFGFLANALVDTFSDGIGPNLTEVAFALSLSLPPVGIWLAVSRYRLYDIDRLISRTVSYGLLTALLAGLYVLSVFVLGAVIPVEGDLPIAGSTLLVAAVFNPLRKRTQDVVDRRFNRARYNARRLVETFSRRLRTEHDLVGIEDQLAETVSFTMQPTSVSLWLRPAPNAAPLPFSRTERTP